MTWDVEDRIPIRHMVRDPDRVLTNATVEVALRGPDGVLVDPAPTVTPFGTGVYDASFVATARGKWRWKWTVTGAVEEVAYGSVDVGDPAATTYATLEDLKEMPGITGTTRDGQLQRALTSAARQVDSATGRRAGGFALDPIITTRVYTPGSRIVSDDDGQRLLVDEIGSAEGLVVAVGSGATWTTVIDWDPSPDNALADCKPITSLWRPSWQLTGGQRVRVTARYGWPVVPPEVPQAVLLQALRLYKRKDSPEGVLGNAEWGTVRVSRVDHDVQALIQHLVLTEV